MLLILCGHKMKQTVWTLQRGGWGWTKKKWFSKNILITGFVLCLGWGGWRKRCRGKIFTPWEEMLLENSDGVCGFPELVPYILDQNTWIWFSLFCNRAEPLFLLKDTQQKNILIYYRIAALFPGKTMLSFVILRKFHHCFEKFKICGLTKSKKFPHLSESSA